MIAPSNIVSGFFLFQLCFKMEVDDNFEYGLVCENIFRAIIIKDF